MNIAYNVNKEEDIKCEIQIKKNWTQNMNLNAESTQVKTGTSKCTGSIFWAFCVVQ